MRELTRNSFANLLGAAIPAFVSVLTLPYIVSTLGNASYGVLALVGSIIGYFTMLDLNFTSGAIKYISEYRALDKRRDLEEVITFGGIAYFFIGLAGLLLLLIFARPLAIVLFKVPSSLQSLCVRCLRLAGVGFLFGQLQGYFQGIPQALLRYDISSRIETAFGALLPMLTVLLIWKGYGLYAIVLLRVCASAANVLILVAIIPVLLPGFRLHRPSKYIAARVSHFSGFAYLSKIAAVTYAQADKLIISSLVGVTALTYYAVPFSLVGRIFGLSYRLGSVMYPLSSELSARNEIAALQKTYFTATRYLFFINCCIATTIVLLAREILGYWMGPAFSRHSSAILALIALASLVDSTTNLPSLVNDGIGFPKLTGLFAVGRAILGVSVVFVLIRHIGLLGAALGQFLASTVSAGAFLVIVHRRNIPVRLTGLWRHSILPSLPGVIAMTFLTLLVRSAEDSRIGYALFVLALAGILFFGYGYFLILLPEHRRLFSNWLHRRSLA